MFHFFYPNKTLITKYVPRHVLKGYKWIRVPYHVWRKYIPEQVLRNYIPEHLLKKYHQDTEKKRRKLLKLLKNRLILIERKMEEDADKMKWQQLCKSLTKHYVANTDHVSNIGQERDVFFCREHYVDE